MPKAIRVSSLLWQRAMYVLGCCRRIVLLLSLLFVSLFAWLWWTLPDPNGLRPEIEAALRDQLALQQLQLGHLSWRWRGDLEIQADQLRLRSEDGRWQLAQARLFIHLSSLALLTGEWLPQRIHIEGGILQWQARPAATLQESSGHDFTLPLLPAMEISVDDMQMHARWQRQHLQLHHVSIRFSSSDRRGSMQSDELQLAVHWTEDGQLARLEGSLPQLHWLPWSAALQLHGHTTMQFQLAHAGHQQWQAKCQLKAADKASFSLPQASFSLPFERLQLNMNIQADRLFQPDTVHQLQLTRLLWQNGKDRIVGKALWRDDQLMLQAESQHLRMAQLWSWLKPIDRDPAWRDWLQHMQHGLIHQASVQLTLHWPTPWQQLPPSLQADAFRYHVVGDVRNADISLGSREHMLRQANAHVELNESGLDADIRAQLPHGIGPAQGHLRLPWDTLMLNVRASARDVDGLRLHQWVDVEGAKRLGWQQARVAGSVSLRWDPKKSSPEFVRAELVPLQDHPWQLHLHGQNLVVSSGKVIWQSDTGLQARQLHVHGALLAGVVDFAGNIRQQQWQFARFSGQLHGQLAELVQAFHLPVARPIGSIQANITLDQGRWQGTVELNNAAWHNFLGQNKRIGQAMKLRFSAYIKGQQLRLSRLSCDDARYQLRGQGALDDDGLTLDMQYIHTRAFQGSLHILAPRGQAPWRMQVRADYLKRKALPASLEAGKTTTTVDKPWLLQADIQRFDWDDARIEHMQLSMDSRRGKLGHFAAAHISSGNLRLTRVTTDFRMPGHGVIELASLKGLVNGQRMTLTATLFPRRKGGLRWRGMVDTQGPFDQLMQEAGTKKKLFDGGRAEILFAGEGVMMQDQPWWQGLRGRLRLRVDEGSIAKGGVLTKLLAISSLADLPALLIGQRKDLTHSGLFYKRLQVEATVADYTVRMHQLAMRATAMDMAGQGSYDLQHNRMDLVMVFRPLQNLDAILSKIPLLRDIIGGSAHSLMRKVYHLHGSLRDADIEQVTPSSVGLSRPGLIEGLLTLPDRWFGQMKAKTP